MAKSTEQKLTDLLDTASQIRFNEADFAHTLSNASFHAQSVFFRCMIAFINYKAIYADFSGEQLSQDSIAAVCQKMRDSLSEQDDTFGTTLSHKTPLTQAPQLW